MSKVNKVVGTGGELLMHQLVAQEVEYAFTNTGSAEAGFFDAFLTVPGVQPILLSVLAGELSDYEAATHAASEGLVPALDRLAEADENAAEVARLRWLVGLSSDQTAVILGCSVRKVQLDWRFAKAFLQRELAGAQD